MTERTNSLRERYGALTVDELQNVAIEVVSMTMPVICWTRSFFVAESQILENIGNIFGVDGARAAHRKIPSVATQRKNYPSLQTRGVRDFDFRDIGWSFRFIYSERPEKQHRYDNRRRYLVSLVWIIAEARRLVWRFLLRR
jgi:hypothetical protein